MASGGSSSRYALRNITHTRFSWILSNKRLEVKELRNVRSYGTSPITPEPDDNKENTHETRNTLGKTIVTHWCVDCTRPAQYRRITLRQLTSLALPKCSNCNGIITIPDGEITGRTTRSRYEAAFTYLIANRHLSVTFQTFIQERR